MIKIYAIICTSNDFAYVGCTKRKLSKRLREHRVMLRKKIHSCKSMITDWHYYGNESFIIKCLEELGDATVDQKRKSELAWMSHYKSQGKLYNEHITSFAPIERARLNGQPKATATIGRKWTPEANEKRRLAQLGKPKNHGAKVSASKKALGQRPTLEAARMGGRRSAEVGGPSKGGQAMAAKRRLEKELMR